MGHSEHDVHHPPAWDSTDTKIHLPGIGQGACEIDRLRPASCGDDCPKAAGKLLAIMMLMRLLRRWNQTGNKWLHIPDLGDWLVR